MKTKKLKTNGKVDKKKSIQLEVIEVLDTIKKNHKKAEKRFDDIFSQNFKRGLNVE